MLLSIVPLECSSSAFLFCVPLECSSSVFLYSVPLVCSSQAFLSSVPLKRSSHLKRQLQFIALHTVTLPFFDIFQRYLASFDSLRAMFHGCAPKMELTVAG